MALSKKFQKYYDTISLWLFVSKILTFVFSNFLRYRLLLEGDSISPTPPLSKFQNFDDSISFVP